MYWSEHEYYTLQKVRLGSPAWTPRSLLQLWMRRYQEGRLLDEHEIYTEYAASSLNAALTVLALSAMQSRSRSATAHTLTPSGAATRATLSAINGGECSKTISKAHDTLGTARDA